MGLRAYNGALLFGIAALWLLGGTQREKPVLADAVGVSSEVRALEDEVAEHPANQASRQKLAQAYLDARAPGLALRLVDAAPGKPHDAPQLEHVYARALLDSGRAADALAIERHVLALCTADEARCDAWLLVSATRRADILNELVQLGVEDAQAHPEASAIAYHAATREAKLAFQ